MKCFQFCGLIATLPLCWLERPLQMEKDVLPPGRLQRAGFIGSGSPESLPSVDLHRAAPFYSVSWYPFLPRPSLPVELMIEASELFFHIIL